MVEESSEKRVESESETGWWLTTYIFLAGILLPLVALIVELTTKMCANDLFDPMPSVWHVLLVAAVPLANIQILWSLKRNKLERLNFLSWISAISAGVALFYSIIYAPLLPISLLGILFFGLGFLPLSPMFALSAIAYLRSEMRKKVGVPTFALGWRGSAVGFLIVLTTLGLSESRFLLTRYGMEKAASENAQMQADGLRFLRRFGNEDHILRLAHSRRRQVYVSDFLWDWISRSPAASSERARETYYRLTGNTVETNDAPTRFSFGDSGERFWRRQEISLASSQMDGSIDNDASLGYVEWTFSLKNSNSSRPLEGFTQIQLPPDAVVSRLTLWIDGEEREAAYAEKRRVTNAYETVTASKRDPVLVTTAGRDRVNLKCFPIPPNGEMKMKVGVTFPLVLEDETNALIRLPYFRDRNFQVPEDVRHSVWLESKRELQSVNKNLRLETKENLYAVRGNLADEELSNYTSSIRAVKSNQFPTVWAKDGKGFVTQEIKIESREKPSRLVFVVDTSAKMREEQRKIVSAIENLPAETEVGLVLTNGNGLNEETSYPNTFIGKPSEAAKKVASATFDGGTDNAPALIKAWDLTADRANSVIIWMHTPQPFAFGSSKELVQRISRRPNQTTLYSISTFNGLDEVEKELAGLDFLQTVPRFADIQTDLERLIGRLNQTKKAFVYQRVNVAPHNFNEAKETSDHLVRLWANDEVKRLYTDEANDEKASALGVKHRIVTPATGAVVLETQEQYRQFGLRPVSKNSVPTIPEPEFYLLLAVVLGVLIWLTATRKLF